MSYKEVLSQAYNITIRNPILWLFGLVMLGGFNLFLINFFTLVPNEDWKRWPLFAENLTGSPITALVAMLLAVLAAFVVLNLVKLIFIVVAHSLVHVQKTLECGLCLRLQRQAESDVRPPYFEWLGQMLIASGVTIFLTMGTTLAANAMLSAQSYNHTAAVIINLLFIAGITCLIGTWNVFTGYFIVLHGMGFKSASGAAVDLLVKHARRVIEFVILLSVIYSISVAVGNAFFHVWNFGFIGDATIIIRIVFLMAFVLWFAINNAFFNMAILIFFIRTVKSTPVAKEPTPVPLAQ